MFGRICSLAFVAIIFIFQPLDAQNLQEGESICIAGKRYAVKQVLGKGFFGTVYKVSSAEGLCYALKESSVEENGLDSQVFRTLFSGNSFWQMLDGPRLWSLLSDIYREFLIGQVLDHANIIHSYAFEPSNGAANTYILMELVDGMPIRCLQKGEIPIIEALRAMTHLLEAVTYAYEQNYLYLDLHEGNLMWGSAQSSQLIDLAGFLSWDEIFSAAVKMGSSSLQEKKMLINSVYIDHVTTLALQIVNKSDFDRNARLKFKKKFKKIVWEYIEDVNEGIANESLLPMLRRLIEYCHILETKRLEILAHKPHDRKF